MYARALFTICLAFALAGCIPSNDDFLRNGIGSNLARKNTADTHKLQRQYFNYLCQEAGIQPHNDYATTSAGCILKAQDSSWNLIVKQGMNDIDRRCDAYLEWLDARKRSKDPNLALLSTARTTAVTAIEIWGGTSAARAMSVVGLAFQLIRDGIENYHSRLILEIDGTTINSIVFRARHQFRDWFNDKQVSNRPDAEHVLRAYLRICLPFAIEAQINQNATLVSLGVSPEDLRDPASGGIGTLHQPPTGSVKKAKVVVLRTPRARVKKERGFEPNKVERVKGGKTEAEKGIELGVGIEIQKMLCVDNSGGDFGRGNIRQKILEFESAYYRGNQVVKPSDAIEKGEYRNYSDALKVLGDCGKTHNTAYEAGIASRTKELRGWLAKAQCLVEKEGTDVDKKKLPSIGSSTKPDWVTNGRITKEARVLISVADALAKSTPNIDPTASLNPTLLGKLASQKYSTCTIVKELN